MPAYTEEMVVTDAQGTQGFYIKSLRLRRELVPVPGKRAYRCLTYQGVRGPRPTDRVLADNVAFEDVLIGMKLKKRRGRAESLFAKGWSGLRLDQFFQGRGTEGTEPDVEELPILD